MFINLNRILNIMIIAMLALMLVLALIFFIKLPWREHSYQGGVDINDNYDPYGKWQKSH